jgi:hypothetical protein
MKKDSHIKAIIVSISAKQLGEEAPVELTDYLGGPGFSLSVLNTEENPRLGTHYLPTRKPLKG